MWRRNLKRNEATTSGLAIDRRHPPSTLLYPSSTTLKFERVHLVALWKLPLLFLYIGTRMRIMLFSRKFSYFFICSSTSTLILTFASRPRLWARNESEFSAGGWRVEGTGGLAMSDGVLRTPGAFHTVKSLIYWSSIILNSATAEARPINSSRDHRSDSIPYPISPVVKQPKISEQKCFHSVLNSSLQLNYVLIPSKTNPQQFTHTHTHAPTQPSPHSRMESRLERRLKWNPESRILSPVFSFF